jgi:hypothetical protein
MYSSRQKQNKNKKNIFYLIIFDRRMGRRGMHIGGKARRKETTWKTKT